MYEKELIEDPNGAALCRCDNCGLVLVNEKPLSNAPKYSVDYADGYLQQFVDMSDNDVSHDIQYFWGCPNCKTDEHLTAL